MADREYILERLKKVIYSFDPDTDIILYGSQAKGTAGPGSDWDFLVLTDTEYDNTRKSEIRNAVYSIELETGEVISVIIHSRNYWNSPRNMVTPFYKNVGRESIAL